MKQMKSPKPFTIFFLALLMLGANPMQCMGDENILFRKDILKRNEGGYHTYRIPTMVITAKGTVLLFCEGRKTSRRDHGDVDLIMTRSMDGGQTWSKHTLIHEEGGNDPIRVGNPCPIIERDGKTIHLLFTRGGGECFFHTKSSDEGLTWSPLKKSSDEPKAKEYSKDSFLKGFGGSPIHVGAGPVHGIHTKKGRLIAPSYVGRTVNGKRQGQSCIIFSDDSGKTWEAGGLIPYVSEFRTGECTIVERSDGSLLMNMRASGPSSYSFGYRTTSVSNDGGMTWSVPKAEKELPGPACQASIIRLNQNEILFLNPAVHHEGGFNLWSRKNLTLRLSKDDGKTWASSRTLNEGLAGYSDMAIKKNGQILCVFENGKRDYCEKISIVCLNRSWLTAREKNQNKN
jgi:sialidase-1